MCSHQTSCPSFDTAASHVVAAHPEQGWSLLCDGAIVFDDTGELREAFGEWAGTQDDATVTGGTSGEPVTVEACAG